MSSTGTETKSIVLQQTYCIATLWSAIHYIMKHGCLMHWGGTRQPWSEQTQPTAVDRTNFFPNIGILWNSLEFFQDTGNLRETFQFLNTIQKYWNLSKYWKSKGKLQLRSNSVVPPIKAAPRPTTLTIQHYRRASQHCKPKDLLLYKIYLILTVYYSAAMFTV